MKKLLFLSVLAGFLSCDDGDLQIEEVDFDEVNLQSCAGLDDLTQTTFFFKIDADEALLLNLEEGLIMNETSQSGTLTSTIPTSSVLIYRLFSDDVSQDYFCDALPPLEPVVINENNATAGNVSIDSRVDTLTATTKDYAHTISIDDLSLLNEQGEQLTDLSTLEYGTLITQTNNSARLEAGPFSNYTDSEFTRCNPPRVDNTVSLVKALNDEFIALDVPEEENLFRNEVTPDTTTRRVSLVDRDIFKYVVLDTLLSDDLVCAEIFDDSIGNWSLVSTSGTIKVTTVAGEPDANGAIEYTHTITLEDLILTALGDGAEVDDVDLPEIPLVELGTYLTNEL